MDKTIKAAILAKHFAAPAFIRRDSAKHKTEQAAADNINWILDTLSQCYDKKKRPPAAILYALGGLREAANSLSEAATLDVTEDCQKERHKRLTHNAESQILACFGRERRGRGQPSKQADQIVLAMADLLCPAVDDDLEPICAPRVNCEHTAAQLVAVKLGCSKRTAIDRWTAYKLQIEEN